MRVRFYDAGQALAALVELPDGRRVLVDAGESPTRAACPVCRDWHRRVVDGLRRDVADARVDLLWITHQHSDHLGGVPGVLEAIDVARYADNGTDLERPTVAAARTAVVAEGATITVVAPGAARVPLPDSAEVRLRAVVPAAWPASCSAHPNDCSIGLRIDYCRSSVLFTGDAERREELRLDPLGAVSLLQVGHHGSETSTTEGFLARVRPRYAVVSSARPDEGTNQGYCHPREATVRRLTAATGGPGAEVVRAFDGATSCRAATAESWRDVPTSDRTWFTARDGEVTLVTAGEGVFRREVTSDGARASLAP